MTINELKTKQIVIYGCGWYGLKCYYELRHRGIFVQCFGDSDETKYGYVLDKIFCVDYDAVIQKNKQETLVIIAMNSSWDVLYKQFVEAGFDSVYVYAECRDAILQLSKIEDARKTLTLDEICSFKSAMEDMIERGNTTIDLRNKDMLQIIKDIENRSS